VPYLLAMENKSSLIEACGVDQLARHLALFLAKRWSLPDGMRQTQQESLAEFISRNAPLLESLTRDQRFVHSHPALVLALVRRRRELLEGRHLSTYPKTDYEL